MDKQIKKLSEQLVKNGLTKALRSAGFTHNGRNYHRRVGSVVQVINVQFSRWNYGTERGFYVNVAFAFDEYRNFFAIPINEIPHEYTSEFSHRLEYMIPNTPHEWVMNPGANVEGLTNLLNEKIMALLEAINGIDSLPKFLVAAQYRNWFAIPGEYSIMARFYRCLGNIKESAKYWQLYQEFLADRDRASLEFLKKLQQK
ncbi:MAG: DUF4304 domain-containing protein [Anaerolineaceae bacterium]|nr:DUF4304 domain-containing protein [Anaerolineaceae bacterium]